MKKFFALLTAAFLMFLLLPSSAARADSPPSVPAHRQVQLTGFNGDDLLLSANFRTASNNGGSVRVVDARMTLLVTETQDVDTARGFANARLMIQTRNGKQVRDLGVIGLGGANGTLVRLGDLITKNQGARLVLQADIRGVQKQTVLRLN